MKLVSFDRHGKSGFGAVIGDGILDLRGSNGVGRAEKVSQRWIP